jgi:cytoskeletal protein CcmA (bactofilin family)
MAKMDGKMANGVAEHKQTTVEEGTEFKGTLNSTCQVMVRGRVEGEVSAPSIIISQTGSVIGNIKAQCIQSEGVLAGRVEADDLYLAGSVRSETVIRAKTLEIKLRSDHKKFEITFGECILDVGDDPNLEDALDDGNADSAIKKSSALARRIDTPTDAKANQQNGSSVLT